MKSSLVSRRGAQAEVRKLNSHLKNLTTTVSHYLVLIDAEMKKPSDGERGKRISKLTNALEMANDQARYFGLGIDWRKDKKK